MQHYLIGFIHWCANFVLIKYIAPGKAWVCVMYIAMIIYQEFVGDKLCTVY